ncbi:MAG: GGDEF domain-containing protein [Minisyncoccia bacterium]
MEEFPKPKRELPKEEVQDAQIGLLEWELEERDKQHAAELEEQDRMHGIDHLTGAMTRKAFEARLAKTLESIRGNGQNEEQRQGEKKIKEASLIFIDLDNFKPVNDTLGHLSGDQVLKKAASLLQGTLREEDILGRLGGDEFVVLLIDTDEKGATVAAEKLRAALDNDSDLKELNVTGSIGVCSSSASGAETSEELIKNADDAAYAAKHGGKNQVKVCQARK